MSIENRWQRLSSKVIYENPWITLREDEVIRPDGSNGIYSIVESPPSVLIAALTEHDEVYLIGTYRYTTSMVSWELPAGGADDGDLLGSARKELQEETGLIAEYWEEIGAFQPMNGVSDQMAYVFLARGLYETDLHNREEEGIHEVRKVPIVEIMRMIQREQITDAHSITALARVLIQLGFLPGSSPTGYARLGSNDPLVSIFVSYRRADTGNYARRIVGKFLRREFSGCRIFIDVDKQIMPGDHWRSVIETVVKESSALIAIIGNSWLSPRLHEPDDVLRVEVATALRITGIRVIPVLVGGATMPKPDELPDDLKGLTECQAVSITDEHFSEEAQAFSSELKATLEDIGLKPEKLRIGGLEVDWVILQASKYKPSDIRTFYKRTRLPLDPDFQQLLEEKTKSVEENRKNGVPNQPFNGKMYKLEAFERSYRRIVGDQEVPELTLHYRPTDYFTQLVTDTNVGNPKRVKFINQGNMMEHPIPELATIMGINLNLITDDGYIAICHRPARVEVAGSLLHTAIAENISRPTDARVYEDGHYAPDPYLAAIRGAREEMGLRLKPNDIHFTHFGVYPVYCQYSLVGWVKPGLTSDEIMQIRVFESPTDKHECEKLEFIKLSLDSIAEYMARTQGKWFPIGQAAVILSLFQQGFSRKDIDGAFRKALR